TALRDQGYPIESKKHYGYRLDPDEDILTEETLGAALGGSGIKGIFLDETVSTNIDAKRMAGEGLQTPFVVASSRQTGGRGRLGRTFESPRGGIYFSLVLKGDEIASPSLLTISAAWAISETMEKLTGIKTSIKWVNDVYIQDKKAVGILTEGIVNMEEGGLSSVVVGCGINLKTRPEEFSPEIRPIVTSFYPDGKTEVTRARVVAECCKAIVEAQKTDFLDGYRKKCFVIGKKIYVVRMGGRKEAEAMGINDQGNLMVRYADGSVEALQSGEVSIRF
ncbi:MAG: biotin--[acetyl-CoA-carboxylase] ligase, partial [Candidatus Ornithospirochaeta sp.]